MQYARASCAGVGISSRNLSRSQKVVPSLLRSGPWWGGGSGEHHTDGKKSWKSCSVLFSSFCAPITAAPLQTGPPPMGALLVRRYGPVLAPRFFDWLTCPNRCRFRRIHPRPESRTYQTRADPLEVAMHERRSWFLGADFSEVSP